MLLLWIVAEHVSLNLFNTSECWAPDRIHSDRKIIVQSFDRYSLYSRRSGKNTRLRLLYSLQNARKETKNKFANKGDLKCNKIQYNVNKQTLMQTQIS